MLRRRRSDPLARNAALSIAAGRMAMGAGAVLATRPALLAFGFPPTDASGRALARLTGGRDIALGLLALLARDNPPALRAVMATGAGVDAIDAISLGLAGARGRDIGAAGAIGPLSGGAAAIVSVWAARRIA